MNCRHFNVELHTVCECSFRLWHVWNMSATVFALTVMAVLCTVQQMLTAALEILI